MEENLRLSKSFFSASSYNIEKRFLLEYISSKSNNKTYFPLEFSIPLVLVYSAPYFLYLSIRLS